MSTKKLKNNEFVESVLSEIKTKYGLKNDSEVAEFLGYSSTGTLANWKKKGQVNFNRIHRYCKDLDLSGLIKNEKTYQVIADKIEKYEHLPIDPQSQKTEKAILLEWIRDRAKSLSEDQQNLYKAVQKLIDLDN